MIWNCKICAVYWHACINFIHEDMYPNGLTRKGNLQLSNADTFPHNHDEIDIELLGHDKRNDWAFQTNIYANGSVSTGREEKFYLWFDPTEQHHQYSIIWNSYHTV